ncbi:pyridoxal phosphate-dependent aminotransferase [Vagococcus sp.]|uniref:pyridoxal phosphate-dependent aminotransferase n=1 Tax=Vagococcus sp. TaxID=1933889 RepID=UPI003F961408
MELAKRVLQLKPSATLAAAAKAKQLKGEGKDVLSLTLGEPDFQTPIAIKKAAIESIEDGRASFYTPSAGIPELLEAIIARTKEDTGVIYQKNEVTVGTGAKFLLYALFQAIINPEDEVLIPVPYWVSYGAQVELAGGIPVYVETSQKTQHKVTVAALETAKTAKTKALVLNTPSNPTGMIYSEAELLAIGDWAIANNCLIIADDIYGKLVYNGNKFVSISSLSKAIQDQTIVINGVSKSYSMTGWRIGYALGRSDIISQMTKLTSQSISNPTAVSQYAALEALSGNQSCVEAMRATFESRLNTIFPLVAALPGVKLEKPQGAFYLYPDVSETVKLCGYSDVSSWVNDLLEEALVAVVSGIGFGTEDHIRMSYATDLETLKAAVQRIEKFITKKMANN